MTRAYPPFFALACALAFCAPTQSMAVCEAASGPKTAALVELYTSEGCSSCPPADRMLKGLTQDRDLIPLALHVGYWDDLGWRDPYAQPRFAHRQQWLAGLATHGAVYTPQLFLDGREVRPGELDKRISEDRNAPPKAHLSLRVEPKGRDALALMVEARSQVPGTELYATVAENGLRSQVRSGENGGRRLEHGHVVRAWIGPVELIDGRAALGRAVPIAEDWRIDRLEVAAFVQDRRDGLVLQAVGTGECLAERGNRP